MSMQIFTQVNERTSGCRASVTNRLLDGRKHRRLKWDCPRAAGRMGWKTPPALRIFSPFFRHPPARLGPLKTDRFGVCPGWLMALFGRVNVLHRLSQLIANVGVNPPLPFVCCPTLQLLIFN